MCAVQKKRKKQAIGTRVAAETGECDVDTQARVPCSAPASRVKGEEKRWKGWLAVGGCAGESIRRKTSPNIHLILKKKAVFPPTFYGQVHRDRWWLSPWMRDRPRVKLTISLPSGPARASLDEGPRSAQANSRAEGRGWPGESPDYSSR